MLKKAEHQPTTLLYGYDATDAKSNYFAHHNIPFWLSRQNPRARLKAQNIFFRRRSTHDEALEEAGIQRARALVTTLPEDADNVYVVLTARQMAPNLHIISRAHA